MNDQAFMGPSAVAPLLETRINWGAVVAGSILAFGFYLLFGSLGAAVGVSISERVRPTTLQDTAIGWAFVTAAGAFFAGGLFTTVLTVGENRVEAVIHGIIMWALTIGLLVALGAVGVRSGLTAMMTTHGTAQGQSWESAAREAGIPDAEINRLRSTASPAETQEVVAASAKRVSWFVFAVIWGTMICAAVGASLGTARTFRAIPAVRTRPGTI